MKPSRLIWIPVTSILVSSCGEDPKLVQKRDEQKMEIIQLKGDVALLEEKLRTMPPDVSEDLTKAGERTAELDAETAKLTAEIKSLESRKREIQAEFDSYRAKYQTKQP